MSKKIEEILPDILSKLSRGISVSTVEVQRRYGFSNSSVRAHLRALKSNFFQNDIAYDASVKRWVALRHGFLEKLLLKPQEIVVLNSMLRGKNRLGKSLSSSIEKMVKSYVEIKSSNVFRQKSSEEITEAMRENYALIYKAIESKLKLSMSFGKHKRVVYPYKIVNIEYYWYLLAYEESRDGESENSRIVKFFTLRNIEDLEISEDTFEYDFSDLGEKIKHIMNAYFSPSSDVVEVELLVHESIEEYIQRARFFALWKRGYGTVIDEKRYISYKVGTTDEKFRDIIPTILKYIPNILVVEPIALREEVAKRLDEYKKIYEV